MDLAFLQVLVNVALFVLIWMVQLIVYPGFNFYPEKNLKQWHQIYATRITVIVFPLMLSQLLLYAFALYSHPSGATLGMFLLVLSTWVITVFFAVPLHNAIDRHPQTTVQRKKLVQVNWSRTVIWTLILIICLFSYGE